MFELGGGGQHDVGVVGGVGLEVFQYHGEQVFARKAAHHLARLRRHRHRVAVVDHHRLHLRAEGGRGFGEQRLADGAHVDGARAALAQQIGSVQGRALDRKFARGRQQQPTGVVAPGAHQRRQAGDRTHRVAAAAHPLHAVVQPDRGRLGGAVGARQIHDLLHRQATDLGRALGRPQQRALAQRLPAQGVARKVVVVEPVVGDELVHQRQGKCRVGAGAQRQVFVAFVGGLALARVDADQARAAPFGFLRDAPKMQVAADGVAAPDDDQLRLGEMLHPHAELAAIGLGQRLSPGRGADGAVQQRGAEAVKEARRHALALHQAHGAGVAVGQDGLRVARRDRAQALGNGVERLVPGDGGELAAALGAAAFQRLQQPIRVVGALGVLGHLGAEYAVGQRVGRVALHFDRAAVLHGGHQGTGVGAVVRAGAAHQYRLGLGIVWVRHIVKLG